MPMGRVMFGRNCTATLHIHTSLYGSSGSFSLIGRPLMARIKICHSPAIAYDNTFKAPLLFKYIAHKTLVSSRRNTKHTIISKHHLLNIGFGHKVLEGWEIGFP